ncbi:unnamed protein product [Closterium sp. NIES-54]
MVQQVLQRFGFTYSSPQSTPLPTGHSLSAPPSDESVEPSGPYPELVGCLMYLMTCTRPDLAYPLSLLARYVAPSRHRKVHWDAAKRVLRYLCSTSGMGLMLGGRARVVLTGHADASWSTRSSSVLSSSCEAEIYAGAMAAQELCWLTYLLTDLGEVPRSPPVLYIDNKAILRGDLVIYPELALPFLDWSYDPLFFPILPMGGMYRLTKEAEYILLIVYVDDLLYIGSTDDITTWFEGELQQDLSLTVSSTVTQYVGLNILNGENTIYLSAAKYADTIAKRVGLSPVAISTPYCYTAGNHQEKSNSLGPAGLRDYQLKLGCLLFPAVICQSDLSYSVSQLATYLKWPEAEHMAELDRALHYLVSTPTIGITYHKTGTTTQKLIGYVDADHAGNSDNRRSCTSYICRLELVGPISWQSSKQELIALSSAEA